MTLVISIAVTVLAIAYHFIYNTGPVGDISSFDALAGSFF